MNPTTKRFIRILALTLFIFGLAGWIYIAVNAEVHPDTLDEPLTHFLPYPREDSFGAASFLVSFIAFFVWRWMQDDG